MHPLAVRRLRRIRGDQALFAGFGDCRSAVVHLQFEVCPGEQVADGRVADA